MIGCESHEETSNMHVINNKVYFCKLLRIKLKVKKVQYYILVSLFAFCSPHRNSNQPCLRLGPTLPIRARQQ